MNTDKLIPIDFSRKFTPFVPGDTYYNSFVDVVLTMDQRDADEFNSNTEFFNTYFLVSFADRPNTGKQPVANDVVVNVIYDDDHAYPGDKNSKGSRMGMANWDLLLPISIVSWKPNHEAMLKQFKSEQGANMNTFTKENTKEATHVIFYHNLSKVAFANKDSNEIFHDDEEWRGSGFMWENSGMAFIELSRPVGERKEDHTNDGVLKKAQPQGAEAYEVALMIEALDDNPDEHKEAAKSDQLNKHIELQVEEVGITSDLDVVISPEPTSVYSGFNASSYEESCKRFEDEDKPVFTQAMSDAGERPPVGSASKLGEIKNPELGMKEWMIGDELICLAHMGMPLNNGDGCKSPVMWNVRDESASTVRLDLIKPIDNRSDDQKLRDAATESLAGYLGDLCPMPDVVNKAIEWHFLRKGYKVSNT